MNDKKDRNLGEIIDSLLEARS